MPNGWSFFSFLFVFYEPAELQRMNEQARARRGLWRETKRRFQKHWLYKVIKFNDVEISWSHFICGYMEYSCFSFVYPHIQNVSTLSHASLFHRFIVNIVRPNRTQTNVDISDDKRRKKIFSIKFDWVRRHPLSIEYMRSSDSNASAFHMCVIDVKG